MTKEGEIIWNRISCLRIWQSFSLNFKFIKDWSIHYEKIGRIRKSNTWLSRTWHYFPAKICGIAARKCKAPQVVGEIIAGLLIGPSLLGWVEQSDFLVQLAEVGVVLLMFSAGLETAYLLYRLHYSLLFMQNQYANWTEQQLLKAFVKIKRICSRLDLRRT